MGDKSPSNPAANAQAQIAQQLFGETSRLRQGTLASLEQFLFGDPFAPVMLPAASGGPVAGGRVARAMPFFPVGGDFPPGQGPAAGATTPGAAPAGQTLGPNPLASVFGPARETIEDQFGVARERILSSSGARGGALGSALAETEMGRARAIGDLQAGIRQQAFNTAVSLVTGVPQITLGGLGSAAAGFGASQQAGATQKAGLGQAAGLAIGLGVGGKPGAAAGGTAGSAVGGGK